MTLSRKMRRAASSGKGKDLRKTMAEAQVALQKVNSSNLKELPSVIKALKEQTTRASLLADALSDDYETLQEKIESNTKELAVLRELLREQLGVDFEARIKAKLTAETQEET